MSYPLSVPAPRRHPSTPGATLSSVTSLFGGGGSGATSPLHRRSPSPNMDEKKGSNRKGDLEGGNLMSKKDEMDLGVERVSSRDRSSPSSSFQLVCVG